MVNRKIKYFVKDNSNTKTYVQVQNNKFTINPWEFNGNIAIGKTDAVIGNTATIKNITYVNYLLNYGSFIGRSSLNELSYNGEQNNWRLSIYLSSSNNYLQWFWLPPDEVINNHITGITITFDENTNVNSLPDIYYKTGAGSYSLYDTNNIIKDNTNNSITINFFGNDSINLDEIITFPEEEHMSYINNYIGRKIKFNTSNSQVLSYVTDNSALHYKCQLFFKKTNINTNNKNILYIKNVTFNIDDSKFISQYITDGFWYAPVRATIADALDQNNIGYVYDNFNPDTIDISNFYIDNQAYLDGQFQTNLSNSLNTTYWPIGQILIADDNGDDNDYRIFPIYFSPGKMHGIINKQTLLTKNNKKILNQDWYSDIDISWTNGDTIDYFDYARPIFLNEKIYYFYAQ